MHQNLRLWPASGYYYLKSWASISVCPWLPFFAYLFALTSCENFFAYFYLDIFNKQYKVKWVIKEFEVYNDQQGLSTQHFFTWRNLLLLIASNKEHKHIHWFKELTKSFLFIYSSGLSYAETDTHKFITFLRREIVDLIRLLPNLNIQIAE